VYQLLKVIMLVMISAFSEVGNRFYQKTVFLFALLGSFFFVQGADYNWAGLCGTVYWMSECPTGNACNGTFVEYTNNWGMVACDASPDFPGVGDSAYMTGVHVDLLSTVSVDQVHVLGTGILTISDNLATLTVGTYMRNDNQVLIVDNAFFKTMNASVDNNGTIECKSSVTANPGYIEIMGFLTISGSGQLILSNGGRILGSGTLTNQASHTIYAGEADIESLMTNNGLIEAYTNGKILRLYSFQKSNNAIITASHGATISIECDMIQSGSGILRANGGLILIKPLGNIFNGLLETAGTGRIDISGTGTVTFDQVVNDGYVRVLETMKLNINNGAMENNGTLEVRGDSTHTGAIVLPSNLLMSGTGAIDLQGGTFDMPDAFILTQDTDHTIQGFGTIPVPIEGFGDVIADVAGETLLLNCSATMKNGGNLIAENSGTLEVNCSVDEDTKAGGPSSGKAIVARGGTVLFNDGITLTSQTLSSSGGGSMIVPQSSQVNLRNGVQNGVIEVRNDAMLEISGASFENNGTIELNKTGGTIGGILFFGTSLDLEGTGEVIMEPGTIHIDEGSSTINTLYHCVAGYGTITGDMANMGTIRATGSGQNLILETDTFSFENQGYLIADTGATLTLNGLGGFTNLIGTLIINGQLSFPGVFSMNSGTITGGGQVHGSINQSRGFIFPGNGGIGTLQISGNCTLGNQSSLSIEVSGPGPIEIDHLEISGTAALQNTLHIIPIKGYIPQVGDIYTVITASSISVQSVQLVNTAYMSLTYSSTSVQVQVNHTTPTPDRNGDGIVNVLDLSEQVATPVIRVGPVDMDGDAEVDLDDLLILVGNWGETMGP
jgi:hypothetical protein